MFHSYNFILSLFVRFDFLSVAVSHLLRETLIASFIKLANQVETFFFHDSAFKGEFVVFSKGTATSEFVIELAEIDHTD